MHTWTTIVSLPLCAALTAVGLALSWLTWRRWGARRGMRAAAWSLLPLAAYLTGAVPLLWRIGSAIANFAQGFAFSTKTWAGVVLFGVSAVIFLVSGGIPLLTSSRKRAEKKQAKAGQGTQRTQAATTSGNAVAVAEGRGERGAGAMATGPAKPAKRGKGAADDDGLDPDIADILRRRGIH